MPLGVGSMSFGILYTGLSLPLAGAIAIGLALALALSRALAGAIAVVGAIVVAGASAETGALTSAGAVVAAGTGAGVLAGASVVALAFTVLGASAVVVTVTGSDGAAASTFGATYALFVLLLPFVNAVFDWTSWQVSRWLGDNLLKISRDQETPPCGGLSAMSAT